MTSPDFWAILRTLARIPDAAEAVFDIVERSLTDAPPAILAHNYEAAIDLLTEFAAAAAAAAIRFDPASQSVARASQKARKLVAPSLSPPGADQRSVLSISSSNYTTRVLNCHYSSCF